MSNINKLIGVLSAVAVVMAPGLASAKDRLQVVLAATGVIPDEQTKTSVIGGGLDVTNRAVPSLQIEYFFTKNISTELFCCLTRHSATATDTLIGDVPLARVTLFPPILTLKYRLRNLGPFEPYVGAGINYTQFFDESIPAGSPVTAIRFDDSVGPAVQFGVDYKLSDRFYVRADARRVWLNSDVSIQAGATAIQAEVQINPWIPSVGVGYRF